MRILVELNEEEHKIGLACGRARGRNAVGRKAKNGMHDSESDLNHIFGVLGEIAVAKYFNLYWNPKTDIFTSQNDIGPFGVRTCGTRKHYLWFYKEDKIGVPQISVRGEKSELTKEFYICGFQLPENFLKVKRENIFRSDRPGFYYCLENELLPIGPKLTPYLRKYFRRRYSELSLLREPHEPPNCQKSQEPLSHN